MLKERESTGSYVQAIMNIVNPDDIVLGLSCDTGALCYLSGIVSVKRVCHGAGTHHRVGLESPFNTRRIGLKINPETAELIKGSSSEVDGKDMNE